MSEEEKRKREVERWKEKTLIARQESIKMQKSVRRMKREILSKLKDLEEEIKDIMYLGDDK